MFILKFTFQLFVKIVIDSVFIRLNSYKIFSYSNTIIGNPSNS